MANNLLPDLAVKIPHPGFSFSLRGIQMGPQPGNSSHLHEEEVRVWKEAKAFRENSSLWREYLEKTVSLIVTFELEGQSR